MTDEYNENAIDGDGDGLVQDGTEWERPAEEPVVEPAVEEPVAEAPKKKTSKKSVNVGEDKVALWSDANLHHISWGALNKGPNIVSKEVAEKWTGHRMVRLAKPSEVADFYQG